MGFQFNHVGGGTKTRRPITLHMKYNSACVQPNCFLVTEDYGEQELTLEELQAGVQLTTGTKCPPAAQSMLWFSSRVQSIAMVPFKGAGAVVPVFSSARRYEAANDL